MIALARQQERTVGRGRLRGLTLIELVVTIAVVAVIMLGVGSAMLIVSHAVPTADNPAGAAIVASQVADSIATELRYAVSIVDSNATMIEFIVADRDANDVPETIRYEWAGTPGDPLIRRYNGGAAVVVLTDVHQFDLSYALTTVSTETQVPAESAETLLSTYDTTSPDGEYDIRDVEEYTQYFLPSLPADAISWKVTRVQFKAMKAGNASGESSVQLRLPAAGGSPSETILEQKALLESSLTSQYTMQEFSFSNVADLAPDQGLCLVFKLVANSTAVDIQGHKDGATPGPGHLLRSTDGGASWSVLSGESLLYWVYGTVTTPGVSQIETIQCLDSVNLTLQAGSDAGACIRTGVRVLNEPEVTP